MCGFILKDASSKQSPTNPVADASGNEPNNNQDEHEERPSRVRQRTISVSGNANFSASAEAPPEPAAQATKQAPQAEPIAAPPKKFSIPEPIPPEPVLHEESEEAFDEDFEEDDEDSAEPTGRATYDENSSAPESELVRKKRRRRRRRKKPAAGGMENLSAPVSPPEYRRDPAIQPQAPVQPIMPAAPVPPVAPVAHVSPPAAAAPAAPVASPVSIRNAPAQEEEGFAPWRTPPATVERATSESRPGFKIDKPVERPAPLPVEVREKVENQRKQEPKQEFRQAAAVGSLVGWLVSFAEDRKGISHELRDGRFFVGREQLRASDFVINDNSVSTPQCLVVCDPVSGVTIQDLMSERGTTLIRGSSALEKSSEQVRLENGDRIRFGEYEMLFVKLPQTR